MTEIEWVSRPELEEWAEVASFDAPGVGAEPPAETFGREAIVQRGLSELDRRGWDSCVVVADGSALTAGVRLAHARPEVVEAMALGHARLSNRMDGERPPMNRGVVEALGQLLQSDYANFVRYGLAQATHGSIGEELAARMLERVPIEVGRAAWEMVVGEAESIEPLLRRLEAPLLFAKHEGCLGYTDEGFEDAVAAFPEARTCSVAETPAGSSEFAMVLREWCTETKGSTTIRRSKSEA